MKGKWLVLYDGVCGLCNRTVQFALKRDRRDLFRFAPLQGDLALSLLSRYGLSAKDLDTVYVVEDHGQPGEHIAKKSKAVFKMLEGLGGPWKLLAWLRFLPLDWAYDLVARYRYRWFGKLDACPLPTKEQRLKFLDL